MKVASYRELEVWKQGIQIVDLVYEMSRRFPVVERFGLASQMQRTAVSIPSNVAEGFSRQHTKEYRQFCFIALGSCSELDTQLEIAKRRHFVSGEDAERLQQLLAIESKMLMSLIKRLREREERVT